MKIKIVMVAVVGMLLSVVNCQASGDYKVEDKNAIVLAMFGTTVEPALTGLLNIHDQVVEKYPNTEVRIGFTSNIIRKIWQKRAHDPEYIKKHPEIPKSILNVKTPLATIADLQNEGYNNIIIQPTHVAMGEEFLDLHTYVDALMSMGTVKKPKYKPFKHVVLSRPLLGTYGTKHPYFEDIEVTAQSLKQDAELALKKNAALVYMGHGNEYMPSGGSYLELSKRMRDLYPGLVVSIGTVEGFPGLNEVIEDLKLRGAKKVILKPLMIVAGDHAMNDMASDEEDSWKTMLSREGFEVETVTKGLGENDKIAEQYVRYLGEAAEDAHLELK